MTLSHKVNYSRPALNKILFMMRDNRIMYGKSGRPRVNYKISDRHCIIKNCRSNDKSMEQIYGQKADMDFNR